MGVFCGTTSSLPHEGGQQKHKCEFHKFLQLVILSIGL